MKGWITAAAETVKALLPFPRCRETVSVFPCCNFSSAVSCPYIFAAYTLNFSPFLLRQLAHPGALPLVLKPSPGHVAALSSAAGTKCCSAQGGLSRLQASLAARYACKRDVIAQILQTFLLGSISDTLVLWISPSSGVLGPRAVPASSPGHQHSLIAFRAVRTAGCCGFWSATCWHFVLLLFTWGMMPLGQMYGGCPCWHLYM